ncbi:MAG: anthranilate phosphoribosyltransferase family protein [Phormidesmis sp. CAN_BIN36]|nr:anthranilate phosphoribosyltransferase family protein [Phormidesmis sp. CAN_BIN36]
MSNAFRELLRKIGSGPHTGENLSRAEAKAATQMMLLQEATPAQIGAFMIAHRIKRPTGEELAGMLDAYEALGPALQPIQSAYPVTVLCLPYDGRSRTAPISPLTSLILASAGVPVILHGGDRMPTKEGVPLLELWQGLGIHWEGLSLDRVQHVLETTGLGFVYLTNHFPLAAGLVTYRDQIGKHPPFATLELMWSPYAGEAHVVCGFVHPPTENMIRDAFARRGITNFTTVKGLEGSCDLPRDRTAIIGVNPSEFERLCLVPRDFGFAAKEVPLSPTPEWVEAARSVLAGKPSELMQAAIWNGGFYLWRCGVCSDLTAGLAKAEALLTQGAAAQKLDEISKATQLLTAVKS